MPWNTNRVGLVLALSICIGAKALAQPPSPDCDGWTPIGAPVERQRAVVAVDEARDRLVVFGGTIGEYSQPVFGDTWEWDGTRWYPQELSGPTPRFNAGACFDPVSRKVMMVGGTAVPNTATGIHTFSNDEWLWTGDSWQLIATQGTLAAAQGATLVADPENARVLRYGGIPVGFNQSFGQTSVWAHDSSGWHQYPRTPAQVGPSLPYTTSVVQPTTYDRVRRRLVVVDGATSVWEWNGAAWSQATPTGGNPQGGRLVLTFDPGTGRTLALAVVNQQSPTIFQWDGLAWTSLGVVQGVSFAGTGINVSIQTWLLPFRGGLVLAGSFADPGAYTDAGDTDLFRIATLRQVDDHWVASIQPNPLHPPTTGLHGLVYDSARRGVVCVGGGRGAFNGYYLTTGTWLLRGERWRQLHTTLDFNVPVIAGTNPTTGRARVLSGDFVRELTEDGWKATRIPTVGSADTTDIPHASDPIHGFDVLSLGQQVRQIGVTTSILVPTIGPFPPDTEGGLAFDPIRGAMVFNCSHGTYALEQNTWTLLQNDRTFRGYPRLVFDPTRQGLIANGGWVSNSLVFPSETYFLPSSGTAWQTLPLRTPPSRKYSSLAWDPDGQRVIYSGGSQHQAAYFRDTWKLAKGPASVGIPPAPVSVLPGQSAVFDVVARGGGVLHYQWRFDGLPLQEGSKYRGVDTDMLTVFGVERADVGRYDVLISNRCGSATSPYATLKLATGQQCEADIANSLGQPKPDERVNHHDLALFADYFFQGDLRADMGGIGGVHTPDGVVDNNDWVAFIDLFFAQCPG